MSQLMRTRKAGRKKWLYQFEIVMSFNNIFCKSCLALWWNFTLAENLQSFILQVIVTKTSAEQPKTNFYLQCIPAP